MTFYHGTDEESWNEIVNEGVLWGKRYVLDKDGNLSKDLQPDRCTYLTNEKRIEMNKGERVAEDSANLVLGQRTKNAVLSAVLAIILAAGFISPVVAQKNGLDVNNPEIKARIESINKEWSDSLTNEDKLDIIHFYAEDQEKLKEMSREDRLALKEAISKKMAEVIDIVNAAPIGKIRLVGFPKRDKTSKTEAEMDAYHHFVNLTNGRIFTGMKGKTIKVFRRGDNESLFVIVEFDLK